ncbi:MAG TPA: hypothetical protein VHE55_17765 [Fimbriimonadaceae bacterium]|nr:hypothetical protein [Fimbriimonadaceae bacterium]
MLAIASFLILAAPLDIPPMTAKEACRRLSERFGKPLQVESRLSDEVVVLRMRNGGEQAIRDGLAQVLHAEWQPDHGGFKLVRSAVEQKKLEQALLDAEAASIQKIVDKIQKQVGEAKSPGTRAAELVAAIKKQNDYVKEMHDSGKPAGISLDVPRMAGPAGRLLNELVVLIGAKELAKSDYREQRVYSNEPTKMEYPLPAGSEEAIREYEETDEQLQGYFQDGKLNIGTDPGPYKDIFDAARKPGGVGKIIVTIRGGRILVYGINIYTRDGKLRTYAYGNSSYVSPITTPTVNVKPVKIPLSKLAAELYAVSPAHPEYAGYDEWPKATPHKEFSAELWKDILNPDKVDPLSLFVGDAVEGVADQKGEDLIGCLPDSLYQAARACQSNGQVNVAQFEPFCGTLGGTRVEHVGGVTYFSPNWPTATESARLPRAALANVMKAYKAAGKETLDDLARFHYEAGWSYSNYIARIYLRLLEYSGVEEMYQAESHPHQFYAFFGSLDDEQRRRVRSGEAIPFSALSPVQRKLGDVWAMAGASEEIEGQPDYMVFATEALPNGPPSTFLFRCENEDVPTIMIDRGGQESEFPDHTYSIADWGRMMARMSKLNKRDMRPMYVSNHYTIGRQQQEKYTLALSGVRWETETFKNDDPHRGEPTSYSELPRELLDKIDQAYDEEMKREGD